ncbi:MAG: fibronectin type III domain-containing protein [Candidatus Marinimicrobia bacterium]|nr:fibronectin type III domain-containing protein [Candidatus Neomarinimicrobiota bacterium]
MKKYLLLTIFSIMVFYGCATVGEKKVEEEYQIAKLSPETINSYFEVQKFLDGCINNSDPIKIIANSKIDTIIVNDNKKNIKIKFNNHFSYIAFRETNVRIIYKTIREKLGRRYSDYKIQIYANDFLIENLIPNVYRKNRKYYDKNRLSKDDKKRIPNVRNISSKNSPNNGLQNRNVALWHSHGWYYENSLDRWEFQRARNFQTVEDIFPMGFTIPYIIPMLENAGANVFVPRERDFQINEVIVDNDNPKNNKYIESNSKWKVGDSLGFAIGNPPYESGENPFRKGTFKKTIADTNGNSIISWIPNIPENGKYAVYISYSQSDENVPDAHYSVYHLGGKTDFLVNQKMGGGTWIYLGKFKFAKGINSKIGKVVLTNRSSEIGKFVTADAVRFGGGMGNISRNGKVSKKPRFVECARYYLQYAGMPDTLVYNLNDDKIDYNDDYQSRGEWVNYLVGDPSGPNKNRYIDGLNIPIDVSMAFHTDAGYDKTIKTPKTLTIFSSNDAEDKKVFPNGVSRLANRDFADILQTEIVNDMSKIYNIEWELRGIWDKGYSEAYRPNVPAGLLEMLVHDNFWNMKYGNDPQFRFNVSRAIYKAILKFLATQNDFEYVVQPLPVDNFSAEFVGENSVKLKWKPKIDKLEPTAKAERYFVYTRKNNGGFDNGIVSENSEIVIDNLEKDVIYSFKITAGNSGGESFPSEILSVCRTTKSKGTCLIINGFDRIDAPATIETEEYQGFMNMWDEGVPDKYDISFIGRQYDFDPKSPWLDDDSPGFGASCSDYEDKVIVGNTFDFPIIHGESLREINYSFVSASDESVRNGSVDLKKYKYVDLIYGEEKSSKNPNEKGKIQFSIFQKKMQKQIYYFLKNGGNIFISGAYVGSDLDSTQSIFANKILKYKWRTDKAVNDNIAYSVDTSFQNIQFCKELNDKIYKVESPDGIEPADSSKAKTILRYSQNNVSAGVGYKGKYDVVIFGFPFETIINKNDRVDLMEYIFNFFNAKSTSVEEKFDGRKKSLNN